MSESKATCSGTRIAEKKTSSMMSPMKPIDEKPETATLNFSSIFEMMSPEAASVASSTF